MYAWLARFVDIRRSEVRAVAKAFATLFLILSAYTVLETARDVLLLTKLPLRNIGLAYIVAAICVLPASGIASRTSQWFGVRRALVGGLVIASGLLLVLFAAPPGAVTTIAIYAVCSLVGAILVPLFWSLIGSIFTVVQGRRLLGPIAAAGALGAAVGSGVAAGILTMVHTRRLLFVSAVMFLLTSMFVVAMYRPKNERRVAPAQKMKAPRPPEIMRQEPFVVRIALLAIASTAAVNALDYFFKWSVARDVPHERVAHFIAVYYAGLNGVALVAQLLGTGALVRRVGVAAALVVTPFLLFLGGSAAWIGGGALAFVIALKTTDGLLRNSVHRIATELIYLPVRSSLRSAAKPFIDGAMARTAQAIVGAVLLALGNAHYLAARPLAAGVVGLLGVWLVLAITTRRPYLALLSRAIANDAIAPHDEADPLDLETAEELVQHLSDEDPLMVTGAMTALARRGRARLIPALVLLHQDEGILLRALAIFSDSEREDWVSRARTLLRDARESVRIAAARALAVHNRLLVSDLDGESGSARLRGYAALYFAREQKELPVLGDARIAAVLSRAGDGGNEARLGLLFALADAPQDDKLLPLLHALEAAATDSREWNEGLARAAAAQRATDMIPRLIARLTERESREAIRATLVAFGQPALDALWATLLDSSLERSLRIQLPDSIGRFGDKRAAELLLEIMESESDGRVRYKSIRALGRVVVEHHVDVERARVERLAYSNLVEYFRLLGLRAALAAAPATASPRIHTTTERLLVGLLDDKLRQSLERVFRLLKIAHPSQSIHRVHVALVSRDLRARANAAEFLDTLLRRPDQRMLRRLFQVLEDDMKMDARVARAAPLLTFAAPRDRQEALERLSRDSDQTLSALAAAHLAEVAGEPMSLEIGGHDVSVGRLPVSLTPQPA